MHAGRRLLFLGVAILAALAALLSRVVFGTDPAERVPAVLNAEWIVRGELLRGGQPQDIDFLNMRDVFGVTGVVNFRPASRIERHVVEGFHLHYLWLRLSPGGAPANDQLKRLVNFIKANNASGGAVFMHDQSGLDQVSAVAVMLEMLNGKTAAETDEALEAAKTNGEIFTDAQIAAINSLAVELGQPQYVPAGYEGSATPANRYPDASTLRW